MTKFICPGRAGSGRFLGMTLGISDLAIRVTAQTPETGTYH